MGKRLRDDVAGAIGELQGPASESDSTVRVAGDERVVRRVGHDRCEPELRAGRGVVDEIPDLEGALEVLGGLRERRGPLGLQAGLHVGRQRLGHAVRRLPVVGQLGGRRGAREARVGAQRLREGQVQRGPLAGQQVGVRGLLEQGVAEGVAVAVVDQHVMGDRLAQRLEQRRARAAPPPWRAADARPACPAAAATRSTARASCEQRLQPQAQHLAQAARQRAGGASRGGQQLLREERVALAARMQPRDELGIGRASEDPRDLRRELSGREGLELDPLDQLAALLLGQERTQRVAAVQLVAAIGADDQQALVAQAAQQRGEELERRAIGPVEVLDDEQRRASRRPADRAARGASRTGGPARTRRRRRRRASSRREAAPQSGTSRASSSSPARRASRRHAASSSRASRRNAAAIGA